MAPTIGPTGFLLLTAGIGLPVRLARWRGAATPAEPLVLIVHIEYAWLGLALVLVVLADLLPASVGWLAALHALTAGAIDTMTQAIMTGAPLGHTARALTADTATRWIYGPVQAGALLRLLSPVLALYYHLALLLAGPLWGAAFP